MTRAWQWQGEPAVALIDTPLPALAEEEVRLRPIINGICATDRELLAGSISASRPPLVPGHEIVAQVAESATEGMKRGSLVVVDTMLGCACCEACRQGRTQLCPNCEEIGLTCDGGWREELVVPARNCWEIPPSASLHVCTLIEPLQCGLGLIRALAPGPGDRLLVVGSGVAAFLIAALGRLVAAEVVMSVDSPERGRLAYELGSETVIGAFRRAASESYTHAVDAVGSAASLSECVDALQPGGRLGLFGLRESSPRFPLHRAIFKNLTLTGHTSAPWLWSEAIGLAIGEDLVLDPLITHVVPFDDVGNWIAEWVSTGGPRGQHLKAVIDHGFA